MNTTEYQKAYKDVRVVVLDEIGLYLDGLQSVADNCKDKKISDRINRYLEKINYTLKSDLFGYNNYT